MESVRVGYGVRLYLAASRMRAKVAEAALKVLRDEAGQSPWVATAMKIGIGVVAAAGLYALVSGNLVPMIQSVGKQITGLPGSSGSSLP